MLHDLVQILCHSSPLELFENTGRKKNKQEVQFQVVGYEVLLLKQMYSMDRCRKLTEVAS